MTDKHTLAFGIPAQGFPIGSVDARMIAVVRCLLAMVALTLVQFDPFAPEARPFASRLLLGAYVLWGLASLVLASRRAQQLRADLDLGALALPEEYFYASLPLCVIDAVFYVRIRPAP